MKLLCRWWQRSLAQFAVCEEEVAPRSGTARHLARCATCRTAWLELSDASNRLRDMSRSPLLPENFDDRLWLQIESSTGLRTVSRTPRQAAPALVMASVGAVCCFWILMPRLMLLPTPPTAASMAEPQASRAAIARQNRPMSPIRDFIPAVGVQKKILQNQLADRSKSPEHDRSGDNGKVARIAEWASISPARPKRRADALHSAHDVKTPLRLAIRRVRNADGRLYSANSRVSSTPMRWKNTGINHETRQDNYSALAASQQAYSQKSDVEHALSAGCAAERAGDTASALDYYAQALEASRPDDKKPNEG